MTTQHLEIEIASHFFRVIKPSSRVLEAILKMCSRYALRAYVREGNKKPTLKITKIFATRTKDNLEFRFHIGQYKEFVDLLESFSITRDMYNVVIRDMYEPLYMDVSLKGGWVLRDYQEEAKKFILEETEDDYRSRLVSMQTGKGKMQPLYSKIKIPGGWNTMGNMKVGNQVIARDGSIATVTGVYPQGKKDIYRIHFADGRYTDCGQEHLWRVFLGNYRQEWVITNTLDIENMLKNNTISRRLYIDLCDPEQDEDIDLPMDPYLLGVILGDGSTCNGGITIINPDVFIFDRLTEILKDDLDIIVRKSKDNKKCLSYGISGGYCGSKSTKNYIVRYLHFIGLMFKRAWEKFIPTKFLQASSQQRLALLQGLMDTDGTVGKEGTCSYSTTSHQLAKDVQYLVRSLGGIAKISTRFPTYSLNGEKKQGRLSYQVNIRHKRPEELFTLPKKKDRTNNNNQYSPTLKLRIKSVEYIGYEEAQCIAIDHPEHLYITDDFIVTHNTVTALSCIESLKVRTLIIVLPSFQEKWASDVVNSTTVNPKEVMIIQGGKNLRNLVEADEEDIKDIKFIIISLSTIKNLFKTYESEPTSIIDEGYSVYPDQICEKLKIGAIIIDEVHMHLHAVFKFLLYTHVPKVIALSATLLTEDPVINNVHHVMFPKEIRFDKLPLDQYIKVYAISFRFRDINRSNIRTTEYGSNNYSHNAFERSLLRNKYVIVGYVKMVDYLIQIGYIDNYLKNDKLAIYVASIAMANHITEHLQKKFRHLDIRRYVEDDPYENVIEPDIRVTTILSAGTALDIPDLRCVIMLTSIASVVSNVQTLGRLRKLKDRDVKFYYVYCEQLPKQKEYHKRKLELFRDRAASVKELAYPDLV